MSAFKHSENFLQVKNLYFTEKKKIKSITFTFSKEKNSSAKFVFENEGEDIVIEGKEQDLVELSLQFQSTIRDGKKELVDLRTTPAYDSGTYYENVEYFIPKGFTDIKEISQRFTDGTAKINPDVDIKQGIVDILENNFDSSDAKEIITNYFESLSLHIFRLNPVLQIYNHVKKNLVKNSVRFNLYMTESDKIFKTSLKNEPVLNSVRILHSKCKADIDYLLLNFKNIINSIDLRWRELYKTTGGKMDGDKAMQFIVPDYARIYEIIKDVIIDFAILLKSESDEINLNSEEQVISFLKRRGYSNLVGTVDNDLRNGSAHSSIDYSSEKGFLLIYDNNTKNRKLIKKIQYSDVLKKYDSLSDLTLAALFSYMMNRELYYLWALDSPDFKFYVVENKPKSNPNAKSS